MTSNFWPSGLILSIDLSLSNITTDIENTFSCLSCQRIILDEADQSSSQNNKKSMLVRSGAWSLYSWHSEARCMRTSMHVRLAWATKEDFVSKQNKSKSDREMIWWVKPLSLPDWSSEFDSIEPRRMKKPNLECCPLMPPHEL